MQASETGRRRRDIARGWLGVALAAVLLWWVLGKTQAGPLLERFREVSGAGLLAAALIHLGHLPFRVARWRALLRPVRSRVSWRDLYDSTVIGYAASIVAPGRLGEVVRPALLARRQSVPIGPCIGSVLVERLFDALAVMLLAGIGLLAGPSSAGAVAETEALRRAYLWVLAALAGLLMAVLAAATARSRLERWSRTQIRPLRWLASLLIEGSRSADVFRDPLAFLEVSAGTTFIWLLIAGSLWVGVGACGVQIGFLGLLTILPLLTLGSAVPTPAGTGGYHLAMSFGLSRLLGVSPELALTAGFLTHLTIVLPLALLGVAALAISGLSLSDLLEAGKRVRAALSVHSQDPPG